MKDDFEPSVTYNFVRSRQLEGTFPGDVSTGYWVITAMRIHKGWGTPTETDWPHDGRGGSWPPPEPPGIDEKAKQNRIGAYMRVRTLEQAREVLYHHRPFVAAFEISAEAWFSSETGIIELPPAPSMLDASHGVCVTGYDNRKQQFLFDNSWGTTWGDQGRGRLPYAYFDRYLLEAWTMTGISERPPVESGTGFWLLNWGTTDFGETLHGVEVYDPKADERVGWGFARCVPGFLDVEELFVKPVFRQKGHARKICILLTELANRARLPLRFWISHADAGSGNFDIVKKLMASMKLTVAPSTVRWASYVAHGVTATTPGQTTGYQPPPARRPSNFGWRRGSV